MKLCHLFATSLLLAVMSFCTIASATVIPEPLFKFNVAHNSSLANFNIGNEFKTGPELYVSKIGAYIAPTQISAGVTTVEYNAYLYADDNTTLLASAVIPVGTLVEAEFAYVPLTYTLTAGTNYVLTSHTSVLNSTSAYSYSLVAGNPTGTWDLGVTFIQNWYDASGTFAPTQTNNGAYMEFMGGNLMVADQLPVPEPSTFALLCLGTIGLVIKARRRRRPA